MARPAGERGVLEAGGVTTRLPGILGDVHRLCGLRRALRFIDAFGGGTLHIPAAIPDDHPVVRLLGAPAARLIAARWGRDRWEPIEIPNGSAALTWYYARRAYLAGYSYAGIRLLLLRKYRLRVAERRIRDLVSDLRGHPRPRRPPAGSDVDLDGTSPPPDPGLIDPLWLPGLPRPGGPAV